MVLEKKKSAAATALYCRLLQAIAGLLQAIAGLLQDYWRLLQAIGAYCRTVRVRILLQAHRLLQAILCGNLRGDAVELKKIGVRYTLVPVFSLRIGYSSKASRLLLLSLMGKGGWIGRVSRVTNFVR